MASLLQNLLLDLKRRGNFVLSELGALDGRLPADFERHRSEAAQRIERAIGLVDQILGDPDVGSPQLEPNFFMDFKRLSELVLNVEDSSLLILKRCSPEDQFLSALLRQICAEVGFPDSPPLCDQDSATHPADEARRAGIARILRLAGENRAADQIDRMWEDLKRLSPSAQPSGYMKRYPARLVEGVGQCIYQLCADLSLRRYSQQQGGSVSAAVAQAWEAFQRDAAKFAAYEAVAIRALRDKLMAR
jgi:hypothetical protein